MAFVEMSAPLAGAARERVAPPAIDRVECASSFAEVAPRWLSLQAQGLTTPYQTFDWARCWAETAGASLGVEPMLVTGMDRRGRAVAILPLGLRRRGGLRIASFLGGKHANLNMGLFDRALLGEITAADVDSMLRRSAASRGVDLFMLGSQPLAYEGVANPMALLPRQPGSSSGWATSLGPDGETTIRGLRSSESLKKLRGKARKLAELGPVSFVEAQDERQVEAFLSAFLAQKAAQFARLGVSDPFADPAIRAFLSAACRLGEGRRPAIGLFALMVGHRAAAVFGAATHGRRRSGMFMSYDADPRVARNSPGDLLVMEMIRASCAAGLSAFDLGAGDGAYKQDFCPEEEPLFDSVLPMNARGRLAAAAIAAALAAKRAAKRNALATATIGRLRRLRAAA